MTRGFKVDLQVQKLDHCFSESSMELLICVVCLSPYDLFSPFDKKLLQLAQFDPYVCLSVEFVVLKNLLSTCILNMTYD